LKVNVLNLSNKFTQWRKDRSYQKVLNELKEDSPMRDFLEAPQLDPDNLLNDCDYLVVDIETTGLSSKKDSLLSVGFVPIVDMSVDLSQTGHFIVQAQAEVGQSATIHGIHDKDIQEQGIPVDQVMQALLEQLKGKVLIVHYAGLDYGFLNKTAKALYGVPLLTPMIDTLEVEKKRQLRQFPNTRPNLRLDECRERYGLPRYLAHNALIDAIATAELWLAQMNYIQEKNSLALKQI